MNAHQRTMAFYCLAALAVCLNAKLLNGQSTQGLAIAVPNGLRTNEGNAFGWYPFDGLGTSSRFQQVYEASQFSTLPESGGFISALIFRLNGGGHTAAR